jgi:hypothetical protein
MVKLPGMCSLPLTTHGETTPRMFQLRPANLLRFQGIYCKVKLLRIRRNTARHKVKNCSSGTYFYHDPQSLPGNTGYKWYVYKKNSKYCKTHFLSLSSFLCCTCVRMLQYTSREKCLALKYVRGGVSALLPGWVIWK